ncbi:hypothetical protein ACU8V4_14690 [Pseudoalteromonas mariniglutinosa]
MKKLSLSFALLLPFAVNAGITDPDCTAEKAVKVLRLKPLLGWVGVVTLPRLQKIAPAK